MTIKRKIRYWKLETYRKLGYKYRKKQINATFDIDVNEKKANRYRKIADCLNSLWNRELNKGRAS